METYHKIQTLFKRHLDGPKKGKMIRGEWTTPALEYLASNQWEFTEKVDGTNIRIGFERTKQENILMDVRGRSDNAMIPSPLRQFLGGHFYDHLDQPQTFLDTWMEDNRLDKVVLFGEGYGPKIQNGGLYREDQSFVLFDVKIGGFWLERSNVDAVAKALNLDSVPVLGHGTLHDAIDIVESGLTWDSHGKMTNWGGSINGKRKFAGLKSTWGDFEAEGIVARTATPLFDRRGERMITKIKGVDFR